MRVFAISGYSGTGKTALVEHIIRALSEQGYVVVTAKTSIHDVKEVEGTDTWKHVQAGAKAAAFLGPHSTIIRHTSEKRLQELFAGIDADLLILEGMTESRIPKVWCVGNTDVDKGKVPQSTKAIISWTQRGTEKEIGIPFLKTEDIAEIVSIVKREAIELSLLKA